jgi:hypothetical protein
MPAVDTAGVTMHCLTAKRDLAGFSIHFIEPSLRSPFKLW